MIFLNKLRPLFAVSLILLIIFRIAIPVYIEIKRQNKINSKDVEDYINNSEDVKITDYSVSDISNEVYMDGVPFVKKHSKKNIAYITDKNTFKVYKIELYKPNIYIRVENNNNEVLFLTVNKKDILKKGTIQDPIVVLRYTLDSDENYYVSKERYRFNVQEFLIYKEYKPLTVKDLSYYFILFWTIISIAGFATTTGILIKKGYINNQGNFDSNGSKH